MKNEEDEVEKFISANTQELGKDKWLCPLSGDFKADPLNTQFLIVLQNQNILIQFINLENAIEILIHL